MLFLFVVVLKGKILGDVSQYSIACSCFSEVIFEKSSEMSNKEKKAILNDEDMKSFFASFSIQSTEEYNKEPNAIFIAKRIYKSYRDDPRNTGFIKFFFLFSFKKYVSVI